MILAPLRMLLVAIGYSPFRLAPLRVLKEYCVWVHRLLILRWKVGLPPDRSMLIWFLFFAVLISWLAHLYYSPAPYGIFFFLPLCESSRKRSVSAGLSDNFLPGVACLERQHFRNMRKKKFCILTYHLYSVCCDFATGRKRSLSWVIGRVSCSLSYPFCFYGSKFLN